MLNKKKSKYELLAPAGDFPMLVAAVNAGADAVYFGLKGFNMRAATKNFSVGDLEEVARICKPHKVKRYLAINTIIYDNELDELEKTIKLIRGKVDAVICWDFAVIKLCKKYKIPFHISTQASISNSAAAEFYKKLGAERLILARELSLGQIKNISKKVNIPLEAFCHGALCVSVSGRCFTSQFLFNKSANRGECLQPCRRTYTIKDEDGNELKLDNNRVLSAKDLCTLPFIEKMKEVGITSFKIEGRNRDARYVDLVVRVYRKALDKKLNKKELDKLLEQLSLVYNRQFSSGFYLGLPTNNDFSNIENSASKEKKHFIGKITHFYPKINVATIKLASKVPVNVGEKIIILGNTTGIIHSEINSMQINHKAVKHANKGQEIGIKVPALVRKNDEVYVIRTR